MNLAFFLAPLILLAGGSLALLLFGPLMKGSRLVAPFALVVVGCAFLCALALLGRPVILFSQLLLLDSVAAYAQVLVLGAALFIIPIAHVWLERTSERETEFYAILLLSLCGALVLILSTHFMSLFLGLELMTLPLYALVAYRIGRRRELEAALKYLLLAGFSAAILVFGMALVFASLQSMDLQTLSRVSFGLSDPMSDHLAVVGLVLILVGLLFKVGAVPFHMWLPDVYEGAPLPVTAYLATVSKGAAFVVLLRVYEKLGLNQFESLTSALVMSACLSMLFGNLMALKQHNVKRLLAYSSIAHGGYMMIGLLSGGELSAPSILFYLTAYFVTIICAFGVITLRGEIQEDEAITVMFSGLFFRRPLLAVVMSLSLMSLFGLPLTAGFSGKLWLIMAGLDGENWLLLGALVVSSGLGFYAYLKIIVAMFHLKHTHLTTQLPMRNRRLLPLTTAFLAVAILVLGVAPEVVGLWLDHVVVV